MDRMVYFLHLNCHKLPLILQNNNKSFSRPFVGNECSNVCTVDCLHPDEYEYGLPIYLLLAAHAAAANSSNNIFPVGTLAALTLRFLDWFGVELQTAQLS